MTKSPAQSRAFLRLWRGQSGGIRGTAGLVGVMQANVIVRPFDAVDYLVVIRVGGVSSNAALVWVQ